MNERDKYIADATRNELRQWVENLSDDQLLKLALSTDVAKETDMKVSDLNDILAEAGLIPQ